MFLILSSTIFAGNEFDCRKMNNKKGLGYGAKYGAFYALGYNDARKKMTDKEFNKVMKKLRKYIKAGCEKNPIYAPTRTEYLCQFCVSSLQKQAIFGDMKQ